MRGFLLTDDDSFLAPYQIGKPAIATEMARLAELVLDNPVQIDRLKKIASLQAQWDEYAQDAIGLRRRNLDYQGWCAPSAPSSSSTRYAASSAT